VTALAPKLTAAEQSVKGRQETKSIEAFDLVLRGIALQQTQRRESVAVARQMFQKAIALDPDYAKAYIWLAWTYHNDWTYQWTQDPNALDRSIEAAQKAVALDASSPAAHDVLGWGWIWKKQLDLGIAELEKAVSLSPNGAEAHARLAEALNFAGRPEEAIGFVKQAMRLDPNYVAWVVFFSGNSYWLLHRYDEAIAAYQEALRRNPDFLPTHQLLAVVYAELGKEKEAQAQAAEVLRMSPGFSVDAMRDRLPFKNQSDLDRSISGLRKAGLK
jgi:tetratricopeptide (TPR) repeat protein